MSKKPELRGGPPGSRGCCRPGPSQAARTPFVLLVVLLLGGGLIGLLLLNSALNEGSFQLERAEEGDEEPHRRGAGAPAGRGRLLRPRGPPAPRPRARHGARRRPGLPRPRTAPCGASRRPPPSSPPRRQPVPAPAGGASPAPVGRDPGEPSPGTAPAAPARPGPLRPPAPPDPAQAPAPRAQPDPDDLRQVTEVSDREPPRRRVPGPARPARPARPGAPRRPGARRPPRRPPPAPAPPRQARAPSGSAAPAPGCAWSASALTLVLLAFVVRLLQVQAVDASAYAAKAEQNRYVGHVLAAERGGITDRGGVALATSVDAYDITADPTMFTRKQLKIDDGPEQAAALLAPILGKDQRRARQEAADPEQGPRYVLLARRQTPQVWKQIKDLKAALADQGARPTRPRVNVLAGVFADPSSKRVYPNERPRRRDTGLGQRRRQGRRRRRAAAQQGPRRQGRQDPLRPVRRPPGAHRGLHRDARRARHATSSSPSTATSSGPRRTPSPSRSRSPGRTAAT